MRTLAIVITGLLLGSASALAGPAPFDEDNWTVQAQQWELVERSGQQALMLQGGSAVLNGAGLQDGVIEFNILFNDERGFSGGIWRLAEGGDNEQFYLRPHQSGKPDANQYQPVFNGNANWQLYHGEAYSAAVTYRPGEWHHVKIVFTGRRAAFHIDSEQPLFVTGELKQPVATGRIGVFASGFAPAWFANFRYSALPAGFALPEPGNPPATLEGRVRRWEVSVPFDATTLTDVVELETAHTEGLEWQALEAEPTGVTNIARLRQRGPGADTAFARLAISSDRGRPLALRFGYSDTARVYLNGRLLYAGSNLYRSRDFRYLGTIGLFDELNLDLRAGDNELLIAVGEQFGGWGLMAQLNRPTGVTVHDR